MAISTPEEIIEDIRQGKMVILMDDEDRENEGDILIAADKITPEAINFMSTYGRGLICLTLTQERCEQLNLPLMVRNNTETFGTNFTISIEAAEGVISGISAKDRCRTVRAAVAPDAVPTDLIMPGRIFPIMSQPGGVLTRAGHTEAGCDIARLAGLTPACVIVEVLKEDGTMARRPELEEFSSLHDIKLGTIADLIAYRYKTEKTVKRIGQSPIQTPFGEFSIITYEGIIDGDIHFALTKGKISPDDETLVRVVHTQNALVDLLYSGNKIWTLPNAMQKIADEGGVMVILANHETNQSVMYKINKICSLDEPPDTTPTPEQFNLVGVGSQILSDIGVSKMRLLTSTSHRYHSLAGFGLEVVDYVCE